MELRKITGHIARPRLRTCPKIWPYLLIRKAWLRTFQGRIETTADHVLYSLLTDATYIHRIHGLARILFGSEKERKKREGQVREKQGSWRQNKQNAQNVERGSSVGVDSRGGRE